MRIAATLAALALALVSCSSAVPRGSAPSTSAPRASDPTAPSSVPARSAPSHGAPGVTTTTYPVRYIAVSVATLWVQPGGARTLDAPSLGNPAYPRTWIASMTVAQKAWLSGKLETQALYGTKVYLLRTYGSWSKIAVTGQPTPRFSLGYPGWLPTRQLTSRAPQPSTYVAIVRVRTTWIWTYASAIGSSGGKVMEISYDTRLPVSSWNTRAVNVVTIGGVHRALRRGDVSIVRAGAALGATGARVIGDARKFLGLQYLWAGTSGFAFDCSGFTHAVFHALGVTIARDADAQALHGRSVPASNLLPGDLVFFADATGHIVHVGFYYGTHDGVRSVLHAPRTGSAIQITPLSAWSRYAGARRYTTA